MSLLTKVFTVLLVVFSVAFTVMTVSIVAQTTDWRDTALKYQQHARVADANLRNLIAANSAELASASDAVRSHLSRIAGLEADLQKAKNDASRIQTELVRADSEKSGGEAINRGLLAQLNACGAGRDGYRSERDTLENRNIELERRNIDLDDRVNEQTAQIAVMHEQKRQFEQQINILKTERDKLAHEAQRIAKGHPVEAPGGAAMTTVSAATPVAATAIRGQVVEVSGAMVTISVGSVDGVEKDMVFVIHRDDQYVGDLKINIVDPHQAAGRIVSTVVSPSTGDLVTDSAWLGGSRG